jgi:hypothetical protein
MPEKPGDSAAACGKGLFSRATEKPTRPSGQKQCEKWEARRGGFPSISPEGPIYQPTIRGGVAFCKNRCFSRVFRMFSVFLCVFLGKYACFSLRSLLPIFLVFFAYRIRFALVF